MGKKHANDQRKIKPIHILKSAVFPINIENMEQHFLPRDGWLQTTSNE